MILWFGTLSGEKYYIDWFNKNYILYPDPVFIKPKLGLLCPAESSYSREETNFVYCCWGFNV